MDYLTNYYKNLSEQLQEKVLILENFLLEGKYIFGINHTDRDASTQILKAADAMGYAVKDGGKHHMIHDPVSGELVTNVSKGTTQSHPGRHRAALLDLSSHQEKIGGFDRDTELKQIRKAMTADIGASGIFREGRVLERNQRNLKENTSIVQPVNRASKILSERRYLPPDDNEGISDEDWYGEHQNRSPKEFGEFIKGLIEKGMSKNSNPFSHMLKKAQIHQLDYHLANPNLTDEHFHEAVPHLLRFAYPETMNNLDIPWDVLKTHAELDLVANPSKHKDMVFRGRENMERILQDYKDGNLGKPK
jgi:hypothetical protein